MLERLGISGSKRHAQAPQRADALADMVLPDHDGRDVRLGDLWADQLAVLVWLRHYGWVHCRDHAVQLHRARDEIGVPLTFIGQASPRQAAHFRRKVGIDFPVLADADRTTYRAVGAKVATAGELLGPTSVVKGMRAAARSGQVQGRVIGHAGQLGGAILVAPGDEIRWTHMSENASDNATAEEIARAVRSMSA